MNPCKRLKYLGYSIVFQEVPNEISLAINISGCPYKCKGCHSSYLWEYNGPYISDDIDSLIDSNLQFITCVCFFGGDQNVEELYELLKLTKEKYKLKTCLYSGKDSMKALAKLFTVLDYIKIGSYKKDLGGLDSPNTNQRMYRIENEGKLIDITDIFQNKRRIDL